MTRPLSNIAILKGGTSAEREISLLTGSTVEKAIRDIPLNVRSFDVDEDALPLEELKQFDVVFIALHGPKGEDGTVQASLERAGIRYTGSDAESSRLAMDKGASKDRFRDAGIPTPEHIAFNGRHSLDELKRIAAQFNYPVVTKPNDNGSSIGITIVKNEAALPAAADLARSFNGKALMERFVKGRMLEVGILGDRALPVIEVIPETEFYDYDAKYKSDKTQFIVDVPLPDAVRDAVQNASLAAHRALGCRDFSRVDLILSDDGTPYVLEVNTIPGFTPMSLLPKASAKVGLPLPALLRHILETAHTRPK